MSQSLRTMRTMRPARWRPYASASAVSSARALAFGAPTRTETLRPEIRSSEGSRARCINSIEIALRSFGRAAAQPRLPHDRCCPHCQRRSVQAVGGWRHSRLDRTADSLPAWPARRLVGSLVEVKSMRPPCDSLPRDRFFGVVTAVHRECTAVARCGLVGVRHRCCPGLLLGSLPRATGCVLRWVVGAGVHLFNTH